MHRLPFYSNFVFRFTKVHVATDVLSKIKADFLSSQNSKLHSLRPEEIYCNF